MALSEQERRQFNLLIASLPKTQRVVGEFADGSAVVIETPSLFGERS